MKPIDAISEVSLDTINRAKAGDLSSFELIYRRHLAAVSGLCKRMAPEAPTEELVQETFLQAWRKLATFRGESALGTWLHQVAVRVVLNQQRTSSRRIPANTSATPAIRHAPRSTPVASVDLKRALATLPERARQVFLLHDVEGYRHREIAEMMDTTEGTSKAQLHRARKLLRQALRHE